MSKGQNKVLARHKVVVISVCALNKVIKKCVKEKISERNFEFFLMLFFKEFERNYG